MADSTKEMCKWLEKIAEQLRTQNRLLKQIADDLIEPPELGTARENSKGCVMLNRVDFDKLLDEADYRENGEEYEDE